MNNQKLPQITFYFWVMKICATTLGETAGDLFSMTMNLGYAVSSTILLSLFIIVFLCQLATRVYHPFLYWSVILLTSTAGTTLSDYMDRTLGLGYATGTVILFSILLSIFFIWRLCGFTFSVDKINGVKAESFYWMAILCSNTLGTALGDFLADDSGLGFAGGALLIASILVLMLLAYYFMPQIPKVVLFWLAFVLTRPLGATMGDLMTKITEKGGLGFGTIGSSIVLVLILLIFINISVKHQRCSSAR